VSRRTHYSEAISMRLWIRQW